jgi:hypothetical protein
VLDLTKSSPVAYATISAAPLSHLAEERVDVADDIVGDDGMAFRAS